MLVVFYEKLKRRNLSHSFNQDKLQTLINLPVLFRWILELCFDKPNHSKYKKYNILNTLKILFKRDLGKLKKEIATYENEANIWIVDKSITNCAGNLCLHLVGNLNHFIGTLLGDTGYVRQRELEFSLKNIPRVTLIKQVEETMEMIEKVLNQLTEADLAKEYPIIVFKQKMSTEFFLIHLTTHLTYHTGQINYHRRLLDQKNNI